MPRPAPPRYAHAEARKSPVVDGRVLRAPDGKELRFPVLLSPQEKEIARMVTLAFGQKVGRRGGGAGRRGGPPRQHRARQMLLSLLRGSNP
jgi:hypothetical protein